MVIWIFYLHLAPVIAFAKAKDKISPIVTKLSIYSGLKNLHYSLDESINMGIFAGIIVGCFTAWIFNQSKEWKTPKIFDFFTGEKFVITLAPVFTVVLGYLLKLYLAIDSKCAGMYLLWALQVLV